MVEKELNNVLSGRLRREQVARDTIQKYSGLPPLSRRGKVRKPCRYKEENGIILYRCNDCEQYLTEEEMGLTKERVNSNCRTCYRISHKKMRDKHRDPSLPKIKKRCYRIVGEKTEQCCTKCDQYLPLESFSLLDGKTIARCRKCCNQGSKKKIKLSREEYAKRRIEQYDALPKVTSRGKPRRKPPYLYINGCIYCECSSCKKNVPLEMLAGTLPQQTKCKECHFVKNREYRQNNQDSIKTKKRKYYIENREYILLNAKRPSKEYRREISRRFQARHAERLKKKRKEDYQKNKEQIRLYKQANRERINKRAYVYEREKVKRDPQARIKRNLRSYIHRSLKERGTRKETRTSDLLGCSIKDFCNHLENQFREGMSWSNYGAWRLGEPKKWTIDHIIPCASFDLTDLEQQKKCFHWSNCRPLWFDENSSKADTILENIV